MKQKKKMIEFRKNIPRILNKIIEKQYVGVLDDLWVLHYLQQFKTWEE